MRECVSVGYRPRSGVAGRKTGVLSALEDAAESFPKAYTQESPWFHVLTNMRVCQSFAF